ncbi:MAG: hypothetical protein P8K78_02325 [Pirellulales bacterium]|nr:hypothetical protein [Pirellulales bacterium]
MRLRYSTQTLFLCTAVIATVLGSWTLTQRIGVPDVVVQLEATLPLRPESVRIDHDPMRSSYSSDPAPKPPWHFVGNASATCPFIVGVDWGTMGGHLFGTGGRSYFLWFFGATLHLQFLDNFYWNS